MAENLKKTSSAELVELAFCNSEMKTKGKDLSLNETVANTPFVRHLLPTIGAAKGWSSNHENRELPSTVQYSGVLYCRVQYKTVQESPHESLVRWPGVGQGFLCDHGLLFQCHVEGREATVTDTLRVRRGRTWGSGCAGENKRQNRYSNCFTF